jgi:dTDP-4-dehydrorhamnose reductase
MRILVAGADGQLGRRVQISLGSHSVTALSHSELDVTSLDQVRAAIRAHEPDLLINASAFNDVDGAESKVETAFLVNAVGPRNLAVATAEVGARVLHVSTDYVFNGSSERPYHEYDEPDPLSVYAHSKLAGERGVASLNPRHYIVRTAWLFDEHGNNPVNRMIARAEAGEVRAVNDQFGSPTYAPHLADAIARLINTDAFGIYHFAGGGGTSWFELTCTVFREAGVDADILPVSAAEFPRPAKRPRYSVLTSIQEPRIVLPPWSDGVKEFAAARKRTAEAGKSGETARTG